MSEPSFGQKTLGALSVALGSMLWATDSLFRVPLLQKGLQPIWIVTLEHGLGWMLLMAFAWLKYKKESFNLAFKDWLILIFIGVFAGAVATLLFTASFQYVNPSIAILLQKVQPLVVLCFASIFLKEKPGKQVLIIAPFALFSAYALNFTSWQQLTWPFGAGFQWNTGCSYALGAAVLWGISTVLARSITQRVPASVVSTYRFGFAFLTLLVISSFLNATLPTFGQFFESGPGGGMTETLKNLLGIAIFPGALSMALYYFGISRIRASSASFIELLFPLSAICINTFFLNMPITGFQIAMGLILILSVLQIRA